MYCPQDTPQSTLLLDAAETTQVGWVAGEPYRVTIDFTPFGSSVAIRGGDGALVAEFVVADNTYTRGFFGGTTFSQPSACVGPLSATCR